MDGSLIMRSLLVLISILLLHWFLSEEMNGSRQMAIPSQIIQSNDRIPVSLPMEVPIPIASPKTSQFDRNATPNPGLSINRHQNLIKSRRVSHCSVPRRWTLWMGDSNMRNTYHWWTMRLKGKHITTTQFGLDRHDLPAGGQWSDQEAIAEHADGTMMRSSFRFLHGPWEEIEFAFRHWHIARMGHAERGKDEPKYKNLKPNVDRSLTSAFAVWATRYQVPIDYQQDNPVFANKVERFVRKQIEPDVVVITEGWTDGQHSKDGHGGGTPRCDQMDKMTQLFLAHPNVQFVWAPMFVTTRRRKRYQCFAEKLKTFAVSNVRIVDLWGQTRRLIKREGYHISVGGVFMRNAVKRFEQAMCG